MLDPKEDLTEVEQKVRLFALGLVIPEVLAQATPHNVQKWEQFCEVLRSKGTAKAIEAANPTLAEHGKRGFQLISVGGPANNFVFCYRRPTQ